MRRRIHPGGYIEEQKERMIHHRTETFSGVKLMLLRAINDNYYQVEQGNHHTYYCPSCFKFRTIVEWRGEVINVYTENFDEDDDLGLR